jgi:hypothetical protein
VKTSKLTCLHQFEMYSRFRSLVHDVKDVVSQKCNLFAEAFFFISGVGLWYCGHYWPIVPAPDDR